MLIAESAPNNYSAAMRIVCSDTAADLIEERGGRLYVWLKRGHCCGATTTLATSSERPEGTEFSRAAGDHRFELYVPAALPRLPDELQLDVGRFPRRVEAFWNGCAWVS